MEAGVEGAAVSSKREQMPSTAAFVDAMRETFGRESIDQAIRLALAGEPTFGAVEDGHVLGSVELLDRSAGCHVVTDDLPAPRSAR